LFADLDSQVPVADNNRGNHDVAIQLSPACSFVENSVDSNISEEIPFIPDIGMHAPCGFFSVNVSNDKVSHCDDDDYDDDDSIKDPDYSPDSSTSSDTADSVDEADVGPAANVNAAINKEPLLSGDLHGSMQGTVDDNSTADHPDEIPIADTEEVVEQTTNDIVVAVTDNASGRKYDKRSYCCFCKMAQSKLVRHLRLVHRNEEEVEELMNESDKQRKNLIISKLRNMGNHQHNRSVIESGKGEFLVTYRPKEEGADYRNYAPCKYCFSYLAKKSIWKHSCPLAPKQPRIRKASNVQVPGTGISSSSSCTGFAFMMSGMRQDEIGRLAAKDSLILELGRKLCNKFGGDQEQFNYVRCQMRLVARLLLKLRSSSADAMATIYDYITPTSFWAVVEAAQNCAGIQGSGSSYLTPSYALKSGGLIRRLAEIKQGQALEKGDATTAESCVQFLKLCDINWKNDVSAVALRNLSDRKRSGVFYLPLTEDVVKLNRHLVSEADGVTEIANIDAFMTLTQVTLAKTILFNRKRQGEVSKMTVEDYKKKNKADSSHEMTHALTEFERGLLQILERVEVRGKKGRTVPVLITEEMSAWLERLLTCRSTFVPAANPYLFATASEHSHFRGSDVLRKYASDCGANKPELLTSTKLRKHIASTVQVVSLKEHELDGLASFLGHDLRVHTKFYRLPSDVLEIAKISKLFLAAERGNLLDFAGKELTDITIADDEPVDTSDTSDCEDPPDATVDSIETVGIVSAPVCGEDPPDATADSIEAAGIVSAPVCETAMDSDCEPSEPPRKKARKPFLKRKWSQYEKEKVSSYFANEIMNKRLPGKAAIQDFMEKCGINRKWTSIKDHIRNTYL